MKVSEQTLLQQMQITEHEVARRKELLRLGAEEAELLSSCRELIGDEIETIVAEFYEAQTADEEIAAIIGDAETVRRLHATQRQYVLDLFSGSTDIDYVNNRLRIGFVHQRIGVEPKLYLSALRILKEVVGNALRRRISDPDLLSKTSQALDKLLYFDMTLVFDTYTRTLLSEVESAKELAEKYAASLELQVAQRTCQLEEKVSELEKALAMVKKLEGVIPICGVCKRIRNDKESWEQLELYISEHSEALFSHGLCPDCYAKELLEIRAIKRGDRTE
jgi:diguanylate cyclase